MKKVTLPGFDCPVEVPNSANYVARDFDGRLFAFESEPHFNKDGKVYLEELNKTYAIKQFPPHLWDIRPTVPPIEGNRFLLRNGETRVIADNCPCIWMEDGRWSYEINNHPMDLVKDLGPVSPIYGPGWYILRNGQPARVWVTDARDGAPVYGEYLDIGQSTSSWFTVGWDINGRYWDEKDDGRDIIRPAFPDEIPE